MWVPTDYFFEQALLELSENSPSSPFIGVLAGAYIGLGVAPTPGLSRGTVLSQITEANFPGYARQPLTWRLPYFGTNGLWNLEAGCVHWQPTGSLAGNLCTLSFIVTAISGGQLLMASIFTPPGEDLSNVQDALTVVARFGMDPLANWGDCTPVN